MKICAKKKTATIQLDFGFSTLQGIVKIAELKIVLLLMVIRCSRCMYSYEYAVLSSEVSLLKYLNYIIINISILVSYRGYLYQYVPRFSFILSFIRSNLLSHQR